MNQNSYRALQSVAAVLGIVVALMLALCVYAWRCGVLSIPGRQSPAVSSPGQAAPLLDINQVSTDAAPSEPLQIGSVYIPGWAQIDAVLNDANGNYSLSSLPFSNPKDNVSYYLAFSLRIDDGTGNYREIGSTGLCLPGNSISKMELSSSVSRGTYKAVLHTQPYRLSDSTPTDNLDAELTLIIH